MPELRSGARQPRSPPLVPAVVAAPPETKTTTRRTTPRRRGGGVVAAAEEVVAVAAAPVGNRVRTRAAVAKEAAVVTTPRVAGRGGKGTGRAGKQARNAKPIVQPTTKVAVAAAVAPAPKAKAAVRGKQVPSRSRSSEPEEEEPLQDPCTSEDNVEEDLDLGEEKQEEAAAEEIREMEEESAGRSAEKLPGVGDDDGSAAPLPERVNWRLSFLFLVLSPFLCGLHNA